MPSPIFEILSNPFFIVLARIILTSFFWIAGIFGVLNFGMMVKVIEAHRLPKPKHIVALMITTELVGSFLLITNVGSLGWLGAGALAVFTALSIPLGHAFWKFDGLKKMEEFQIALEHVALVGGLMCAAVLTL